MKYPFLGPVTSNIQSPSNHQSNVFKFLTGAVPPGIADGRHLRR